MTGAQPDPVRPSRRLKQPSRNGSAGCGHDFWRKPQEQDFRRSTQPVPIAVRRCCRERGRTGRSSSRGRNRCRLPECTWCARSVRPGFSPLGEDLDLLSKHFSPYLVQCIVRLGALIPFEQVPSLLHFLTGIHVSPDTVRRLTEEAGAAQVAIEQGELEELERTCPPERSGPPVQQLGADGAMVPLVHGVWAEARTLVIGTVEQDEAGEPHTNDLSYFSRLCSADAFIRLATLPTHERGTRGAGAVVAVMDGASWLQELIDEQRPDAVRILDFPHAVEYLSRAAQAAFGPGTREASVWLDEWAPKLKKGNPDEVLAAIQRLPAPTGEAATARRKALVYLRQRRAQVSYASFQDEGYPIGSGIAESACKLVVEARMKGSGMHWQRANVSPMLALRGIACSDQWEAGWPRIWAYLRSEAITRRHDRRRERHPAPPPASARPQPATAERPKLVVNGRPTREHPWKSAYPAPNPWTRHAAATL